MARTSNELLKKMSGTIGKQLVFKQYGDKTVVTKYPNMGDIKPSEQQKSSRKRFADAVHYAKAINRNPEQKALYLQKVEKGQSVYHYALKEYLEREK